MCRFLLVRSKGKIKPEKLLFQFAQMCKESNAPDGDWQGDGWGIAGKILNPKSEIRKWEIHKSLNPIWKDRQEFSKFPETNVFAIHARSAGFPQHKGVIEYNQPYVSGDLCFVFNGMIKGVKMDRVLSGKIGAQKIFSLIKEEQKNKSIREVLKTVDEVLLEKSEKIIGMNIGVIQNDKFYMLCEYENNPSYFGIRFHQDENMTLVCSEPIGNYPWKIMKKGDIITL